MTEIKVPKRRTSGRQKGTIKTGGRQKGTPNRRTAELQAKIEASGVTPLDFMLKVMRDEDEDLELRCDMAKSAAPYVHARLSSVDARVDVDGKLVININKPV